MKNDFHYRFWPLLILLFALISVAVKGQDISKRPANIPASARLAYVVGVRDGDNLTVRDSVSSIKDTLGNSHLKLSPSYEVRIFAIDAPGIYMGPKFAPAQPYGLESKAILKDTLLSRFVYIDSLNLSYNRKVARVWFQDGRDVAEFSLANGLSWYSEQRGVLVDYQAVLKKTWITARSEKKGLFVNKKAIHPVLFKSRWRDEQKKKERSASRKSVPEFSPGDE